MRSVRVFFAASLLIFLTGVSGNAEEQFNETIAMDHLKILTSDEFEGRRVGMPGGKKAAQWIADKFKEYGLIPGGDANTFFQNFKISVTASLRPVHLIHHPPVGKTKEFKYGADYQVLSYSGSGTVKARIAFVGYGISAPKKGLDEYAGIDVKGKIVVAFRGAPGPKWEAERYIGYKSKTAFKHGAVGFILVEGKSPSSGTIQEAFYVEKMPAIWASLDTVQELLASSKKDVLQAKTQIDKNLRPMSFVSDTEISLEVHSVFLKDAPARNVIGIIPGTDKKLSEECVVICAHFDHLGNGVTAQIYRGADDNASGTATMLEIARLMKANKFRPKRTVVFIGFDAEELGLKGAKYLASTPEWPARRIAVVLNMDMVGRGKGDGVSMGNLPWFPVVGKILEDGLPEASQKLIRRWVSGGGGGSDQAVFFRLGIPGFHIMSTGNHKGYHTFTDNPDVIEPKALKIVGEVVYASALILANYPNPLAVGDRLLQKNYFSKNIFYSGTLDHESVKKIRHAGLDFLIRDIRFKPADGAEGLTREVKATVKSLQKNSTGNLSGVKAVDLPGGMHGLANGGVFGVVFRLVGDLSALDSFEKLKDLSKNGVWIWGPALNSKPLNKKDLSLIEFMRDQNIVLEVSGVEGKNLKALLDSGVKVIYRVRAMSLLPGVPDILRGRKNVLLCVELPAEGAAALPVRVLPGLLRILRDGSWKGVPVTFVFGGELSEKFSTDVMPAENILTLLKTAQAVGASEKTINSIFGGALITFLTPPKKDVKKK